jgi:cobalt-precorrin-7 (C5)-methyltransferase
MALNPGSRPIAIVGCGPGALDYLTSAARQTIDAAEVLVGAPRLLDLFPAATAERVPVSACVSAALDRMAEHVGLRPVVVLVSGDPGVCSLSQPVIRRFGLDCCWIVPGVSSLQVAFARLGLDWLDARLLSTHAYVPEVDAAALGQENKIAILAGNSANMPWVVSLAGALEKTHRIYLCEDLTLPEEKVLCVSAHELGERSVASRTVVMLVAKGMTK